MSKQHQEIKSVTHHKEGARLLGYGEGNFYGKYKAKVKKDKPENKLEVPLFDAKGDFNLPVFKFTKAESEEE